MNDVATNAPGSSLATATIIGMTNDNTTATPYYNGTAMTNKIVIWKRNTGCTGAINSTYGQRYGPSQKLWLPIQFFPQPKTKTGGYLAHKWDEQVIWHLIIHIRHLGLTCLCDGNAALIPPINRPIAAGLTG